MFKILSKKRINSLESDLNKVQTSLTDYQTKLDEATQMLMESRKENDSLREKVETLEKEIEEKATAEVEDDTNSVTIQVSDDLEKITPIVRYNPDVVDVMVELGFLSEGVLALSNERAVAYAIQVALINIAYDGLHQIIDSFEENSSDA